MNAATVKQDTGLFRKILEAVNESQRRWLVGREALRLGRGGIQRMVEESGLSKPTILKGIRELRSKRQLAVEGRVRKPGGGRKRIEHGDPGFTRLLEQVMDESTVGDKSHADRDRQFRNINKTAKRFLRRREPVISVDTKKKERVGNFKNNGRKWRKKAEAPKVNVHDFPSLAEGTAIPYGAYDVHRNEGMVNVGMTHDTAEFAVESTILPGQASGTRSSTACSPTSA